MGVAYTIGLNRICKLLGLDPNVYADDPGAVFLLAATRIERLSAELAAARVDRFGAELRLLNALTNDIGALWPED